MHEEVKQAWLQANTLWCDGLRSRITPRQCAENRRRARSGEYAPIIGRHCPHCSGLDPEQLKSPEPAQSANGKKAEDREVATRRCSSCKQKKPRSRFRRSKVTGNLLKRCLDCEGNVGSGRHHETRL
jgi:hypothetical protein